MKYIVDIPDGVEWGVVTCRTEDGFYTRDFDSLEELNSDYINEHYGDLQDEAYQEGYKACMSENDFDSPCTSCEAYQRGLNDAWEAAKKIFGYEMDGGIPLNEIGKVFGYAEDAIFCTADIIRHNTASEAIAKLKAYEEKQKADDEIKVGDEVAFHHDDGRPDTVVVVTYIGQDGFIDGMDGRGTQYAHKNPTKWTKTGRHFDIGKILEEMKE